MPALSFISLTAQEQVELKTLVWQVLTTGLEQQKFVLPKAPITAALQQRLASFVTLYLNGELKGCIGGYMASKPLWQDVCEHSYQSAFEDYRFSVLCLEDLAELSVEISILSALEPIENRGEQALRTELVVGVDGLLLEDGYHRAIFLPSVWRALKTPELFINALKQKGGWPVAYWSDKLTLSRFQTVIY